MAAAQYGNFSPKEDDPFPIESVLAPLATGGSSAMAAKMLDMYQLQRQTAVDNYSSALGVQHDFAKQQLAAQIADNAAKNLKGFMGEPGGVQLIAGSPGYNYLLGGASPDAVGTFTGQQTRLQDANIADKGSTAVNNLASAGLATNPTGATAITGLPTAPSVPTSVQAAAARGNNQRPEHFQSVINIGVDKAGNPVNVTIPMPFGVSPEERDARIANGVQVEAAAHPGMKFHPGMERYATGGGSSGGGGSVDNQGKAIPPPGTPGSNPLLGPLPGADGAPPGSGIGGSGAPPSRKPNLPMAKTDTPAGGAQAAPPAQPAPQAAPAAGPRTVEAQPGSNQLVLDGKIQAMARSAARLMPEETRSDIAVNATGGVLKLYPGQTQGQYVIQGKSGKFYALAPQ